MPSRRGLALGFLLLLAGCAPASTLRPAPAPPAVELAAGPADAEVGAEGRPAREGTPDPRLGQLRLRCAMPECPPGIGLVVRTDLPRLLPRCTGSLVGPDRVLTAAHCLDEEMRRAGARCDGVWVGFPETPGSPVEWVECARVDRVSGGPVSVLRPDFAVLELERPVDRRVLEVRGTSLAGASIVTVVSVTPHPIYRRHHRVDSRLCPLVGPEEVRAVLGPTASSVAWLRECPILPGNSGSPVLDAEGRVRGIVHGGSHPILRVGVMTDLSDVVGPAPEEGSGDAEGLLESRSYVVTSSTSAARPGPFRL